ncbi:DDE-type integrase/transposase/recombinase [Paenibacillus ginsengarvi]|uniref:DDE-type integrase/transposase/recombinase n=1 Tax=Paenibacillus ginsengarvi TaxID=400777 RepID=UPI003B834F91
MRSAWRSLLKYLLRGVPITHVNQVWGIDITYCGTPTGFVYLVAIIDWYSRYTVGYAVSNTMVRLYSKSRKRGGKGAWHARNHTLLEQECKMNRQ